MAWIESHQSLGSHPKLFAFADTLGIHPAQAIGHLHYLWWWAIEYATDGNVTRYVTVTDGYYSSPILLRATQYPGKEEDILTALLDCGWIDRVQDDQFFIHDWDQYSNRLITMRQVNAEKQRRFRERQKAAVTGYVTVTSPLHNRTTRPNQTKPNTTQPNQTKDISSADADCDSDKMPQAMLGACLEHPEAPKSAVTAEAIYSEYPKKVGKPHALQAIKRAMSKTEAERLLELTKAFAVARKGFPVQYCPNPATWFNQERYNDDPAMWAINDALNGERGQAKPVHQAEANLARDNTIVVGEMEF